jgi:hypothetical protein
MFLSGLAKSADRLNTSFFQVYNKNSCVGGQNKIQFLKYATIRQKPECQFCGFYDKNSSIYVLVLLAIFKTSFCLINYSFDISIFNLNKIILYPYFQMKTNSLLFRHLKHGSKNNCACTLYFKVLKLCLPILFSAPYA